MAKPDQVGGGVAILIHKDIEYNQISSTSFSGDKLEYMGIKLKLGEAILNAILFYNPRGSYRQEELEFYASQVNGNKVNCGDFNAKHPLWDSKTRNSAGNVHFDFLTKSTSLSLLTPQDLPTRFDPVISRTSTLFLFIGNNKYISNCKVTSSSNISGTSGHYPKFLRN